MKPNEDLIKRTNEKLKVLNENLIVPNTPQSSHIRRINDEDISLDNNNN